MDSQIWLRIWALVALVWLVWGCTSLRTQSNYEVERGIIVKKVDGIDLQADLYLPKKEGLRPAVLVVHGGGWESRSGDMESLCRKLADEGFVVMNSSYRMAPENLYPKAVEDVRDSFRWLQSHASQYRVDASRISGWGYSAGAHLILLAGLEPELKFRALVAGGTPADLTVWPKAKLVVQFLGVPYEENSELWREASPINHVRTSSPPVFLYHGEWDHLVEHDQMVRLKQVLSQKGVVNETYSVPYAGHLFVYFFSSESIRRGIDFLNRANEAH